MVLVEVKTEAKPPAPPGPENSREKRSAPEKKLEPVDGATVSVNGFAIGMTNKAGKIYTKPLSTCVTFTIEAKKSGYEDQKVVDYEVTLDSNPKVVTLELKKIE